MSGVGLHWLGASLILIGACTGSIEDPGSEPDRAPVPSPPMDHPPVDEQIDPDRSPVGELGDNPGRSVRRLSASQFGRSLQIATGQAWRQQARFAAALGEPDLSDVTSEDLSLSASFEKLVEDAARDTCYDAVMADRSGGDVILHHASASDRGETALRENLKYLVLRFWGERVTDDTDSRLTPWMNLLRVGTVADDDAMAARWQAVCVGLITHPNFLTY